MSVSCAFLRYFPFFQIVDPLRSASYLCGAVLEVRSLIAFAADSCLVLVALFLLVAFVVVAAVVVAVVVVVVVVVGCCCCCCFCWW